VVSVAVSDISSYDAFEIDGTTVRYHFSWGEHSCVYRLQVLGEGALAAPDPALAFRVGLGLAPYFFSFLTPDRLRVRAGSLAPAEQAQWERWYTHGLAEKSYRQGLDPGTRITADPQRDLPPVCAPAAAGVGDTLLMNGGGKDTAVAAELLRASGEPFRWLSVNEKPAQRALREASGEGAGLQVKGGWEKLPPVAAFRYPGMPPLLLFYDLAAVLAARMAGAGAVAVGNERSADFGNLPYRGLEVNHQYTKSDGFERELAALLDALGSGVRFYSPLRPLYELQIAEAFASLPRYHAHFMSCNEGQLGGRRQWCGRCAKCAFLALILEPFLSAEETAAIFGRDFLDDPALLPELLAIAGLEGHKPFECVGRPEEALAAVFAWPPDREPPLAIRELRARVPEPRLREAAAEIAGAWGPAGLIPPELLPRLQEAWRALRNR
jgi:UDP-N-acetyl-alpha-D-muramoyl-L-alanyl-L-glutamate epimerase